MFEGIITNILNKVLGEFLEGISTEQLSISLFSGDVELYNLSIKPNILDNMPLPFKLKYGKVGKVFVDVPVTGILSKPLKIEISEIFMLVEPKDVSEWSEKIIEEAFITSVQSSLANLEEYFKTQLEIQNSEPGMAANMVNKIIDNTQIDIRNVYMRFEDNVSNPKVPYALGMCLEAIQLYTCNDSWERAFVAGKDISCKMAKITNFQMFLNFSDEDNGMKETVRFDELTEDMHLDEVQDPEIKNIIKTRQEKGVAPGPTIVRVKNFLLEEIKSKRKNRNLIEKFCIEARIKLNKDPKKNGKPQADINLVIGGKYKDGKMELEESEEGIGFFKLQKQQMNSILKYLDYSTNYTKFQTGVQKKFLSNKFSKEESRKYMKIYEEWKQSDGDDVNKKHSKKTEKLRNEMKEIETKHSYEQCAAVRQIAINRYSLDFRKKQYRDDIQKKIKHFESSKEDGYFSSLWGKRNDEQKQKDEDEIREYKRKLNEEFEDKFKDEDQKMDKKMDEMLKDDPAFDQDALQDMPKEWTMLVAAVVIPKLRFVLLAKHSKVGEEKSIMEMQSSGMRTKAKIGQDWQDIELAFGKLNIIDNITGSSVYQFLTETVFPGENKKKDHRDAVSIHLQNNPRFEDGEIKINLRTKAHQYIFVNMPLIEELQNFFVANDRPEDEVDLTYYKDQAKARALDYINQGADYLDEVQQDTHYAHKGIEVDLEVFAPILVIPESVTELTNKKTLVFNLGYIRITSNLRPYHSDVDYKAINRGEELYDQYDLTLNGFQLSMIEELVEYKQWERAQRKIDIINQISISLKANRSMEPFHPIFPSIELFCKIHDINIYISDYIVANLMNIQGALMPPEDNKVQEFDDLDDFDKRNKDHDKKKKSPKKDGMKRKKGRKFEHSDSEEDKEPNKESDGEESEGEENAVAEEEDAKSNGSNDPKSFNTKSKSDVENHPENQLEPKSKKNTKVDQRILLVFDKMSIIIGEVVPKNKIRKYERMISEEKSDIPHINILEMNMEGLELEFNNGQSQNLNLIMTRLYIKDLQEVVNMKDGMECGVKSLVPHCFQKILSNPEIEKEFDDDVGEYSSDLRTVRTEDFKSIRGDEEDSAAFSERAKNHITQFRLALQMEGDTISVEFVLANLEFIVTLPIAERLMKFQSKIADLQEKDDEEKVKEKIGFINKFLQRADEESDSDETENSERKQEKIDKATELLMRNAKKVRDQKKEEAKGYYQQFLEQRNEYLMKGKKLKLIHVEKKSNINAKGRLSNFSLKIPLDSLSETSRVLQLSLSMRLGYKGSTLIKNTINQITNQTIESVTVKDQQDANVILTQLAITMINQHLFKVDDEFSEEKLLLPSRIGIVYDKLFSQPKDSDITNIEMTIEPIEMKIGFRELDNFRQLGETMLEFSNRIAKNDSPDVQELYAENDLDKDNTAKGKITGNDEVKVPDDDDHKTLSNAEKTESKLEKLEGDRQELMKQLENPNKRKPKKAIRERKFKQIIKMRVKLLSESINFSLMDDTGLHEYPLVNFNISKILATYETETGEDNAVSFILKKMGISEHPNMKLDSGLLLESRYFNIESGYYEPLIEPWTFSAMVIQKTATSIMEVSLTSEEMLNVNLTYGMALAVKRIMKKLTEKTEEWENEKANEESKMKSFNQSRKNSKRKTNMSKRKIREGEADEETMGFNFYNRLGLGLKITLENYANWKEQGIELEQEDEETATITFEEWEDPSEKNFRSMRELNGITKFVKRKQNNGKLVENFEENIVRFDLYVDGFEPIMGVPIEISGRRSYELYLPGESEKQRKKAKYQYSLIVNVKPEGKRKDVSFESQMTIVNKTEFDIEIAQILTQGIDDKHTTQLTREQVENCLAKISIAVKEQDQGGDSKYEDMELFNLIPANQEFNVPLRWFLDEVAIFYKCERGKNVHYRRLVPNLRNSCLRKDRDFKDYQESPKYHLFQQENIENIFIASDMAIHKCRPTALERPPHFEISLKPPICMNNMLFSELSVFRHGDQKLLTVIKPGDYAYLYTGVKHEREEPGSDSEDEKIQELQKMDKDDPKSKELYQGEVHLNKYVMKFVDDGNVVYQSEPDYLYSIDVDYKFRPEMNDDLASEDDFGGSVTIKLEANKFNTFVFTPYILINKSDIPIYFGKKDAKLKKTIKLNPHSNEFFNPLKEKKNKFSICVDQYEWADNFDISTLGMSGEGAMKRLKDVDRESEIVQKYNSNLLNMGILISQLSAPFGKTTAIKFIPRYVFVNHSSRPLVLAQDWDKAERQYYIKPGGSVTYNFENKGKQDNFVKLREVREKDDIKGHFENYTDIATTDWSSRFSIDDFEDFQISLKSFESVYLEETKSVKVDNASTTSPIKDLHGKDRKWYEPSKDNDYRRFVRVIITTQDEATLFIMLCDPNMPEYRINNYSSKNVSVYQKDIGKRAIIRTAKKAEIPKESHPKDSDVTTYPIPFVWDDQTKDDKKIIVEIDGVKKEYDLDEIEEKKELIVKRKKFYVKLVSTGYFREFEIRDKKTVKNDPEKSSAILRSLMTQNNVRNGYKANLDLRGVGISIVDKEPKEILYISLFKILLKAESEAKNKGNGVIETTEECDLILYHFQIDNMVSLENPILFSPDEIFDKQKILTDEEYTPFVQIKVSYSHNQSANVSRRKVDAFQVMIQKMKAEVETGTLNVIINTVTEITGVFGDQGTEYLSAQTVKQKEAIKMEKERSDRAALVSLKPNKNKQGEEIIDDQDFRKEEI